MTRVLVCGNRTFEDDAIVWTVLDGLQWRNTDDGPITVIEGQCPYGGADKHAEDWAKRSASDHVPFPADWDRHGKVAGPIRNQQMLDEGRPDLVVAFVDKPLSTSRGTRDMVERAKAAGLPVYVVEKIA